MTHTPPSPRSSRPRRALTLALLTLTLAATTLTVPTGAQPQAASSRPLADFDVRTDKAFSPAYAAVAAAPPAGASALVQARVAGVARLRADFGNVAVITNPELELPEVIGRPAGAGFLSEPVVDRVAALRGFVGAYADVYGIADSDVTELRVVADYENPAGNMAWAELEQRINGLPVFRGCIRGGFTAKGELARITGTLVPAGTAEALATEPAFGAAAAVSMAAATVGWSVPAARAEIAVDDGIITLERGTMAASPTAWRLYFPLRPGVNRLAWATVIWGDPEVYLVILDAQTGTTLFRKNLTDHQTQSATYGVYASDSPAPSSPTTATPDNNLQAPFVTRTVFTLVGNEAPNTFNNLGWIPDGGNTTAGNNVIAGIDRDGTNGVDAPVTGSPNRVFNFAYDPATQEPLTAAYQQGDVTNMFYWTNRFHDETYRLGFTEAARNFQTDNFGRGGLANDRVSAEGQDSSGSNNANFSTVPDGTAGRMQMYLWTGPTPDRSGDLDQEVILHELTHGLSNRLHGNAVGLSSNMSRGMGEGWSDFYARALLSTPDENVNGVFAEGGWATKEIAAGFNANYYYGIRRFPHAVRSAVGPNGRPHNPLTFADADSTQFNVTDGAYPRGPVGSAITDQVHNLGEIWSNTLFEVRARFITRLGWQTGNQRILQFVTDAMKLDPVNPTFLQARDSILAAAQAGGGTAADIADIWAGFATRGMGVLASVENSGTGADNTRVTENFNVPGDAVPTFTINDVALPEGNAGGTTFTFTVTLANPNAGVSKVNWAAAPGTANNGQITVSSAGPIVIPDMGPAPPYPTPIAVAGLTGTITQMAVRLNGVTHTFPGDIDALLVAPGGQKSLFMSDIGASSDVLAADLTFQDGAPPPPASLVTGTYAPTDVTPGDVLPAPAPAGPYTSPLSVFNGTDPNGTWNLFLSDDAAGDSGSVQSVSLIFTLTSNSDFIPASGQLTFAPGTTTQTVNITVNGDTQPEPAETFTVNLSGAVNAVIGDAQGVGTILDDETVQPPTGVVASQIAGNVVTLRWTPPAFGPVPTGYVLEGGVAPGDVLASVPTGSTLPIFTFAAPTGAFHVRIHSLAGAARSGPSNELPIFVNIPAPPSAPQGLVGTVNGSGLELAWRNTFSGGAPTSLLLDVSGALTATLPLGLSDTFSFPAVPPGTYAMRVRAVNAAGSSGASNPVTLTFPGTCSGAPQPPANFLAFATGNVVTLLWDPAAAGSASMSYVLNVSGSFAGNFPLATRTFTAAAPAGTYTLSVQAVNGCGTSAPTAPQAVTIH